jgi:hypothetical protein
MGEAEAHKVAIEANNLCKEIYNEVFVKLFGVEATRLLDNPKEIDKYVNRLKKQAPAKIEIAFDKIQEYKEKIAKYNNNKELEKYEPQVYDKVKKYVKVMLEIEGSVFQQPPSKTT